ncbi:MAG: hypothetical protein KAJ34_05995 [Thermodesulfovibrionia bacterium]|nr:hypothetical protein [Thermodesulfovibrionia bacterium]
MNKFVFSILLTAVTLLFLNSPDVSFAVDKGGCLTCHQYPGLVRLEETGDFKMLHIDEEKHLASAHGKVDCKKCHAEVVEIPHTGKTKVECTKTCHVEDREKIDAADASALSEYHKDEIFAITRLEDKSSCRVCHPLYPHSNNNKVRALANMHTGFLLCEVCHLKKDSSKKLTYDWKKPDVFEFIGEPYGTHEKRESKKPEKNNGVMSKMLKIFSEEGNGANGEKKTEYLISRIAVFSIKSDKKELLMNTKDNEKAKEFLDKEKEMQPAEKERELKYFHREIAKQEISVACDECHSPNGILDFRKLGFNETEAKDLEYMNIKSLLTKYETFVIPNLFGPK